MDSLHERVSCLSQQEAAYRFFARVLLREVDEPFLAAVSDLCVQDGDWVRSLGGDELVRYCAEAGPSARTDLAVDYAKVFLGAGVSDGRAAYPYESVYTSEERLVMQGARDEVVAAYAAQGLGVEAGNAEPEDHLGYELDFVASLCQRRAACLESGDEAAEADLAEAQQEFVEAHPARWVPAFCADVRRCASTGLYRGVASMLEEFLKREAGAEIEACA